MQRRSNNFCWYMPLKHTAITSVGVCANLLSRETFAVAAATTALYGLARLADEPLQKHFFCYEKRKNINQCLGLYHFIHTGHIIGAIGLGIYSFWKGTVEDINWYADAVGNISCIFSALISKNIFKAFFKHEAGLRPYHEKYAPFKRAYGGCPSGHMSILTSIATYWWKRRGWRYGLPFACLGAGTAFSLVNVNRHYISQVVAGTGLGIIVGIAADRAVAFLKNVCEDVRCSVSYDMEAKQPVLSVEYSF